MLSTLDRFALADLHAAGGELPRSRVPLSDRDLRDLERRGLVRVARHSDPSATTFVFGL